MVFGEIVKASEARHRQMVTSASRAVKMAQGLPVAESVASQDNSMLMRGSRVSSRRYELLRSWVFVCIHAIARRVSGQPLHVGIQQGAQPNQPRGGQRLRKAQVHERSKMPATIRAKASSAYQELMVYEEHPVLDLFAMPNPAQDKHAFFMQTLVNYYLTGIAYLLYGQSKEGRPELWAVPSHWITPKHEGGLFTSYELKTSDITEPITLDPENVGRFYFPDPADLKRSISPIETQLEAVTTDRHIQKAQENAFENGIYPSIILKVGRNVGPDGTVTETRPVLTAKQRRQISTAVKKVWGGVANFGDPAIVDGLIEGIERLQATPREMDFKQSGEIVKKRIFQMFGLNPITVGEITAANRAQAVEAEKNLANGVVNPLIDGLSNLLTLMLGPLFEPNRRLCIWLEEHAPVDPELELKRWAIAKQHDVVTVDEFRAHVLNLGPKEEEEGEDEPDPGGGGDPEDADDPGLDDPMRAAKGKRRLTRRGVHRLHVKQAKQHEEEVSRVLARFFRGADQGCCEEPAAGDGRRAAGRGGAG